jgi:hypothetical protein
VPSAGLEAVNRVHVELLWKIRASRVRWPGLAGLGLELPGGPAGRMTRLPGRHREPEWLVGILHTVGRSRPGLDASEPGFEAKEPGGLRPGPRRRRPRPGGPGRTPPEKPRERGARHRERADPPPALRPLNRVPGELL